MRGLGDVVILAGKNGSGKTRILKLLERYINDLSTGIDEKIVQISIEDNKKHEITLDTTNSDLIEIVNYSHYDAQLQLPKMFTPYVIHNAKNILEKCNYEETALNSLLFLYDMAKGYSDEFKNGKEFDKFKKHIAKVFNIEISADKSAKGKELKLFGQKIDKVNLSPGQQYLLRMAIACYRNCSNKKMVFFLDEPELHLHPKALIDIVILLRKSFKQSQFWISTHSLPLIAFLTATVKSTTAYNVIEGNPQLFRSDPFPLVDGLIGSTDNLIAIRDILSEPDEYASNRFSVECYNPPETLGAQPNDAQNKMVAQILKPGDVVVDYGVGKGRFFEGIGIDYYTEKLSERIEYYAFDPDTKDAEKCKAVMKEYGSSPHNYYNDVVALKGTISSRANYVLLINVLHEIDPKYWEEVFSNIRELLNDNGRLIIVERSELTIGEAPFDNGFLVLGENSAKQLFGVENIEYTTHPEKDYIEKYSISKQGLNVTTKKIKLAIKTIKEDSYNKIKSLKTVPGCEAKYKNGLKTTFWLHQYANATMILENEFLKDNK